MFLCKYPSRDLCVSRLTFCTRRSPAADCECFFANICRETSPRVEEGFAREEEVGILWMFLCKYPSRDLCVSRLTFCTRRSPAANCECFFAKSKDATASLGQRLPAEHVRRGHQHHQQSDADTVEGIDRCSGTCVGHIQFP